MVQLRRRLAKFIRERRGPLSQRAFARKSGLGQSTIMRIENLDQNVTVDTLEQLCKAFHVDVAELFPMVQSPAVYIEQRPQMISIHEKKLNETNIEDKPFGDSRLDDKRSGDRKQGNKKLDDKKSNR
jgi:transcriptional regulator with XRE-family HTH domain